MAGHDGEVAVASVLVVVTGAAGCDVTVAEGVAELRYPAALQPASTRTRARGASRLRIGPWCQPYGWWVPRLVPTCVWKATPALLLTLDERFGEPVDTYVNGSQVWLRDDGPGGVALEWRLHPVAGYRRPPGLATEEVFDAVTAALATGKEPRVPLDRLWDGLEAFAAYDDEVEPATLAAACTQSLGLAPDAAGLADHDLIGDQWERSRGGISIVAALLEQLA